MSKTNIRVKGIGGNISILGKLTCDITLGDDTSPAFCNVDTLITTSDIPILIGQNILGHHTLLSYTIDNQEATVELTRTLPSGKLKHTVPLSTTVHPRIKPTHNLSHGALTVSNEEPRAIARSSPNGLTLNQKLHWLKQTVGLSLPDHHSRSELEATADLLISYADILGTDDNRRGTFIKPIRIPTNGQSRSQKQHPIAQALEDDVDAEIARMASEGVIEPCNDPKGFNSPVFAVRKKNGKIRVVANFKRTLNKVLVDLDPYPIPTIDSTFNKIGEGKKYFWTLDLRNGYWQIVIDERDRHKTAFTWKGRCFQYTRLAFGLTSAGQIFSRCITEALDTVASCVNISSYIDDNLVHAKTFEEYVTALEQLFIALRKFGLKLNPEKCIFLASEAKFLGHIVNSDGFKADPEYVRAIIDMKPPTTRKELQSLIGRLVWIRQFIETRLNESIRTDMFSNLIAPINELNKPGRTFVWTEGAYKAFNKIKKRLASPPIISFPDFTGLFTLTTDASDIACGAILMQENKHGRKKIIAVASHTFNATERNWSTTEREAYAIKWAITKFDYFLRSRPFVVLTDHLSLTYLDQREFNNAKIRRWQEEISCYKFVLEYVEGESNVWADMLSRRYGHSKDKLTADPTPAGKRFKLQGSSLNIYVPSWCMDEIKSSQLLPGIHTTRNIQHHLQAIDAFLAFHATSTIPVEEIADHMGIAAEQASDDTLSKIIRALQLATPRPDATLLDPKDHRTGLYNKHMHQFYLEPGTSVLMIRDTTNTPKLVVPYKLRTKYLHQAHDCVNHSGISRMQEHLSSYWWEFKNRDIRAYVQSCQTCAKRKGNYGMRRNWSTGHCKRGGKPFEVVYIDFVSMPLSKGKRYILTILDSFSRHLMAIPCARDRAIDAARGLYQFFLRHREIPRIVSSDRGTHFTGEAYKEFCDLTSITRELHCPWRPQSSGNIERQHRTFKNALYMICEDRNCEWTDVLESAVSSMNATANTATGASPHYIITGRQPNIGLPKIPCQDIVNNNPGAYGMQINALLRQVHQRVALANNEADHKMEAKLNRSIFKDPIQVGDKVLLHRPQSATAHLSHLPWIGDFEVTKTNGLVVQVKNDNCEMHWVHRGHVRRLVPRPNDLQHMHRPPPPPALSPPHQIPNHPSTRPLLSPCPPRQPTHHPLSQLPTLSSGEHLVANDCSSGDNTQNPTKRTTRGQLPARFKDFVMCQKTK